ncbi:hypothetical protein DPMN_175121 [Dreissena polymorpha]|uniref:Uncharacterized protein n=1 Tax=Dreissena polymorpha TaxID=45954 RepID=A0A9D4E5Y6_DREPO|nr:hypothetical protein DPMN_175121 [Dreissena polymorpha]
MSVTYGVDEPDTLLNSSIAQDSRKEEFNSQVVENAARVDENASQVVYNDSRIVNNEVVTDIEIETEAKDELIEDTETDLEEESEACFDNDCATQTDSIENAILKKMKMMNELLLDTKFRLNNFQQKTRLQLSQLRDEIACFKNTISLANQQSTDKVETISQSTDKLSKVLKQANDALHRKLQSVHNYIKKKFPSTVNMSERLVQNEHSERATTGTSQSEKSNNNGSGNDRKEREQSSTEEQRKVNTDIVDTTERSDKTLIMSDSILSGINRRVLNKNTHIKTLPGRTIKDIRLTLDTLNMKTYENVITHFSGIDMAEGGDARKAYREIKQLLH